MDEKTIRKTLETVTEIDSLLNQNGVKRQREFITIYGILLLDLIKTGSVKVNIVKPEQDNTKKMNPIVGLVLEDTSSKEETSTAEDQVEVIDGKIKHYILATDLFRIMGEDQYNHYVLGLPLKKKEKKKQTTAAVKNVVFDVNAGFEDEEEKVEEKKEEPKVVKEDPKEISAATRIPAFSDYSKLKKDPEGKKNCHTFLYERHKLILTRETKKMNINFYVYPLKCESQNLAPDIMVVAEMAGNVRAGISRGTTSAVNVEFNSFKFVVRGLWKDKKFEGLVTCMNANNVEIEDKKYPIDWSKKTSTLYVHTVINGRDTYIFPGKFLANNDSGLAPAAVAIKDGDDLAILCPTADGNFIITENNGQVSTLDTYWIGDDFCYEIS